MHSLEQWFEDGCVYEDGVALYAAHGSDTGLKTLLGFGETRYNGRKLYAAMEDLQQRQAQVEQVEEEKAAIAKASAAEKDPRLSELYPERHMLHAQLSALPSKSDRYRVARKIIAITDKVERILGVIEYTPQKDHTLPKNPMELLKLRNNNRSYISKKRNQENSLGEVQRRIDENIKIEGLLNEVKTEPKIETSPERKLIISVIGNIAAGKTTLCKKIQQQLDCQYIEVNEKYRISNPIVLFESSGLGWKVKNITRRFEYGITIMVECSEKESLKRLAVRDKEGYNYLREVMSPSDFYYQLKKQLPALDYDFKFNSETDDFTAIIEFIHKQSVQYGIK